MNQRQTWLRGIMGAWRELERDEGMTQTSRQRATIILTGLYGAGKSTLYNSLQGFEVSPVSHEADSEGMIDAQEDLGLFTLVDLPTDEQQATVSNWSSMQEAVPIVPGWDMPAYEPMPPMPGWGMSTASFVPEAELVLFVVDGQTGFEAASYRWFRRLHARGEPLIVVVNKIDLMTQEPAQVARQLARRLAVPVVPVSASEETNLWEKLLPQMIDLCPSLSVPLGRELAPFRQQAAKQLVNRAALTCGAVGLEPLPILDMPFQLFLEIRMVMQLANLYGRSVGRGAAHRKEIILALLFGAFLRYAAQQMLKLTPFIGWFLSGLVSLIGVWLMGFLSTRYFEWLHKDESIKARVSEIRQQVAQQSAARVQATVDTGKQRLNMLQDKVGKGTNQVRERLNRL